MIYDGIQFFVLITDLWKATTKELMKKNPLQLIAWWRYIVAVILVNIGCWGNGLLCEGTKPLPESMFIYQWNCKGDISAFSVWKIVPEDHFTDTFSIAVQIQWHFLMG